MRSMDRDAFVVLDVRSPAEFASGHIEGAVNVPLEALARYAGRLARDAALVTVCGTSLREGRQYAPGARLVPGSLALWRHESVARHGPCTNQGPTGAVA
jgi:hypothetical protein